MSIFYYSYGCEERDFYLHERVLPNTEPQRKVPLGHGISPHVRQLVCFFEVQRRMYTWQTGHRTGPC